MTKDDGERLAVALAVISKRYAGRLPAEEYRLLGFDTTTGNRLPPFDDVQARAEKVVWDCLTFLVGEKTLPPLPEKRKPGRPPRKSVEVQTTTGEPAEADSAPE